MRNLTLVVFLLVATAVAAQQAVPKELAALQGTWVVVTVDGEDLAARGLDGLITFTGERYASGFNGTFTEGGTIKVDASKKPVTIDFVIAQGPPDDVGKTQLGLVEIGPDTVRMILNRGGDIRPSNFEPGADLALIVLKRKL